MDPATARLRASAAAHEKWANCPDRSAATAAARAANLNRFERLVREAHPDWTDEQVRVAAENKKRAHYKRMALKSAKVRRLKKQTAALEAEIAAESAEGEVA